MREGWARVRRDRGGRGRGAGGGVIIVLRGKEMGIARNEWIGLFRFGFLVWSLGRMEGWLWNLDGMRGNSSLFACCMGE